VRLNHLANKATLGSTKDLETAILEISKNDFPAAFKKFLFDSPDYAAFLTHKKEEEKKKKAAKKASKTSNVTTEGNPAGAIDTDKEDGDQSTGPSTSHANAALNAAKKKVTTQVLKSLAKALKDKAAGRAGEAAHLNESGMTPSPEQMISTPSPQVPVAIPDQNSYLQAIYDEYRNRPSRFKTYNILQDTTIVLNESLVIPNPKLSVEQHFSVAIILAEKITGGRRGAKTFTLNVLGSTSQPDILASNLYLLVKIM